MGTAPHAPGGQHWAPAALGGEHQHLEKLRRVWVKGRSGVGLGLGLGVGLRSQGTPTLWGHQDNTTAPVQGHEALQKVLPSRQEFTQIPREPLTHCPGCTACCL